MNPLINSYKESLNLYNLYNLKPFDENFFEINNINAKYPVDCNNYIKLKNISKILYYWSLQNIIFLNCDFEGFFDIWLEPLQFLEDLPNISKLNFSVEKKKIFDKKFKKYSDYTNVILFPYNNYYKYNFNFYYTKLLFKSLAYKKIEYILKYTMYLNFLENFLILNNKFFYTTENFNNFFFFFKYLDFNMLFNSVEYVTNLKILEFPVIFYSELKLIDQNLIFDDFLEKTIVNICNKTNFNTNSLSKFDKKINNKYISNLLQTNSFFVFNSVSFYPVSTILPENYDLYTYICYDLNFKNEKNLKRLDLIRCIYTPSSLNTISRPARHYEEEYWDRAACVYDCCVFKRIGFFTKCSQVHQNCFFVEPLQWETNVKNIYDLKSVDKPISLNRRLIYNFRYIPLKKKKKFRITFKNYENKFETQCPYGYYLLPFKYYENMSDFLFDKYSLKRFTI